MRISYSLTAIGQKVADILIASGLNVAQWSGSNVAAPNVAGYPLVDTRYHRGTLENTLIGNRRDVNVGVMQTDSLSAAAVSAAAAAKIYPGMVVEHVSGSSTWTNSGDNIDVPITAVSAITRAYVVPRFMELQGAAATGRKYSWAFTSTTNVRFTLRENLSGAETVTVYFSVVSL